jgi:hypothetical protein
MDVAVPSGAIAAVRLPGGEGEGVTSADLPTGDGSRAVAPTDVAPTAGNRGDALCIAAGWLTCVVSWVLASAALAVALGAGESVLSNDVMLHWTLAVGNTLLGAFLITRHPRSVIGALLAITGLSRALGVAAQEWSLRGLAGPRPSLPAADVMSWVGAWIWLPSVALASLTVLLFPDGRLPARRWLPVVGLSVASLVLLTVVVPAGMWGFRGRRLLRGAPTPDSSSAQAVNVALALVSALGWSP